MSAYTQANAANHDSSLSEFQTMLLERINNIITALLPEFKEKSQAMRAVTLSDNELMKLIYATQLEHHIHVPERELRKMKRRA